MKTFGLLIFFMKSSLRSFLGQDASQLSFHKFPFWLSAEQQKSKVQQMPPVQNLCEDWYCGGAVIADWYSDVMLACVGENKQSITSVFGSINSKDFFSKDVLKSYWCIYPWQKLVSMLPRSHVSLSGFCYCFGSLGDNRDFIGLRCETANRARC